MRSSFISLGFILLLSGCSLSSERKAFDLALSQDSYASAEKIAIDYGTDGQTGAKELLWALEAGAMLRFNQHSAISTAVFDNAEVIIKQEDLRGALSSGASQTASILVNDNVMSYRPMVYDKVMVNTYKALNFWQLQDFDNARVEWNRADDRQRQAAEHFTKEIFSQRNALNKDKDQLGATYSDTLKLLNQTGVNLDRWLPYEGYINPASLYLHGLYFLLNGNSPSDFERARTSFSRAYALTRNAQIRQDIRNSTYGKNLPAGVWVIFENGLASRKIERRLDLPLFIVSNRIDYFGIALPALAPGQPAFNHLRINQSKTETFAMMDKIIQGEFKTEFTGILIKEITRAIIKTSAQSSMRQSDDKLVRALGRFTAAYQAISTQADLRSWHTLPHNFQVGYTAWPKNGKLALSTSTGLPIDVQLPSIPQPIVIYVRALTPTGLPQVNVLTSKNAIQ